MLKKWKVMTIVWVLMMGMLAMGNSVQAQKKPTVLNVIVWAGARAEGPTRGLAKDYQKLNPQVKFNIEAGPYEDYTTRVAFDVVSGTNAYDIVWLDPKYLGGFVKAGYIEPLDKYLLEDPAWWQDYKSDVYPQLVSGPSRCVIEGRYYALTSDSNCIISYYRKDVFAEAGIEKPPDNWDELFEVAAKIHNPPKMHAMGGTFRGFWAWDTFMPFLYSAGGREWDWETKTPRINDKAAIRAAEVYKEMFKWVPRDALSWGEELLLEALAKSGTIAMAPVSNASPVPTDPNLCKFADVMGATTIPKLDGNAQSIAGGFFWILSARSLVKDEAWDFLKFVMGRENIEKYIEYGGQPIRISALFHPKAEEMGKPYYRIMAEGLKTAIPVSTDPQRVKFQEVIGRQLIDILRERKSIKQALDEAQGLTWKIMVDSGQFKPKDVPAEYRKYL